MRNEGNYEISIVGCHDETCFEVKLTHTEFLLIKKIEELSIKHSKTECNPKIFIRLKSK